MPRYPVQPVVTANKQGKPVPHGSSCPVGWTMVEDHDGRLVYVKDRS